ncbi:MAG: inner-membrane translocator [Ktedonobacterales bacterium]|nr:inner-membrane translocator [Ktedonobacterales bacterium]
MSAEATSTTPPAAPKTEGGFNLGSLLQRDVGQLPIIAALVLMAIYFNFASDGLFLSSRNLSNLVGQSSVNATVALAAVMVLLIGEIDLSLAVVAYLCGAVTVTLSVYHGFSAVAAIAAGLAAGALIGLINGAIIALLRVPSFIVTLAASLGYTGLLQHLLLPQTTIRLVDPGITGIAADYLPDWLGAALPIVGVVAYAGYQVYDYQRRRRLELTVVPIWQLGLNIAVAALLIGLALYQFQSYLGVPIATTIVVGLILVFWIVMRFTTFGRYVYAVGGNAEAARRSGISISRIRILIFVLASTLAGVAGILESSRTISAAAQIPPTLLLEAIAAAVIGGVSLFGGRGSVWGVLVGSLVIGSLINGLILQGRTSDIQFMVEGLVLLLAVVVDALLRRRSAVVGR